MEANLRRTVNELTEKLQRIDMQCRKVEAALRGQIRDANRKLEVSNNDKNKLETALRDEIKRLEKIIRDTQKSQRSGKGPS
jgi:septal ring factor EnvC (AmiA/AmiB activator)